MSHNKKETNKEGFIVRTICSNEPVEDLSKKKPLSEQYNPNAKKQQRILAEKVSYSMMTHVDLRSSIRMFFPSKTSIHFLREKTTKVFHFCMSRQEYLTQEDLYVFLHLEVKEIIDGLSSENISRFCDLCCKAVQEYQDGFLATRTYKPGPKSSWKKKKYPCYNSRTKTDPGLMELYQDEQFYKERFPNKDAMFRTYIEAMKEVEEEDYSNSFNYNEIGTYSEKGKSTNKDDNFTKPKESKAINLSSFSYGRNHYVLSRQDYLEKIDKFYRFENVYFISQRYLVKKFIIDKSDDYFYFSRPIDKEFKVIDKQETKQDNITIDKTKEEKEENVENTIHDDKSTKQDSCSVTLPVTKNDNKIQYVYPPKESNISSKKSSSTKSVRFLNQNSCIFTQTIPKKKIKRTTNNVSHMGNTFSKRQTMNNISDSTKEQDSCSFSKVCPKKHISSWRKNLSNTADTDKEQNVPRKSFISTKTDKPKEKDSFFWSQDSCSMGQANRNKYNTSWVNGYSRQISTNRDSIASWNATK